MIGKGCCDLSMGVGEGIIIEGEKGSLSRPFESHGVIGLLYRIISFPLPFSWKIHGWTLFDGVAHTLHTIPLSSRTINLSFGLRTVVYGWKERREEGEEEEDV